MAYHIGANENGCCNSGSVLYLQTEGGTANTLVAARNKYPEFKNVKLAVRALPINLFNDENDIAKVVSIKEISKSMAMLKFCVLIQSPEQHKGS